MGNFFCDVLSREHEVAIYDIEAERLRFTFNALRFTTMDEIREFQPELMINARFRLLTRYSPICQIAALYLT